MRGRDMPSRPIRWVAATGCVGLRARVHVCLSCSQLVETPWELSALQQDVIPLITAHKKGLQHLPLPVNG